MGHRRRPSYRGWAGARSSAGAAGVALALALLAAPLGGCSIGIPIGSLVDEEATGSIAPPSPLTPRIDGADWTLAEPAFQAALGDPAEAAPRRWRGARSAGSFAAVGGGQQRHEAPHRKAETCRSFVAGVERAGAERAGAERAGAERAGAERAGAEQAGAPKGAAPGATEWLQGVACRLDTGEWSPREVAPWRRPV